MTRVPPARRELIPPDLQQAFDAALHRHGGVPRYGNHTVMLYSPEACERVHHWADYLRKDSILSDSVREHAMLVTAREHDCQYIWNVHAAAGRRAGLSSELLDAVRDKKSLPSLKPEEAAVIRYGQEYYRTLHVSKGTFEEALAKFGVQGVVELTMLMGFCALLAFNLHAFDIDLPDQRTEPLLPV